LRILRNPTAVHPPLAAYTHQIEVPGTASWLVMSGQVGRKADGTIPEDPVEQLAVALANVGSNLEAAQMGVGDVFKLTIYLTGEVDRQAQRAAVQGWLGSHKPCMTLLFVSPLAAPDYRVEIDAWACDSDRHSRA